MAQAEAAQGKTMSKLQLFVFIYCVYVQRKIMKTAELKNKKPTTELIN